MGIMAPVARAILREHKHRPITGEGLLIGRQSVPLTIEQARAMVFEEGVALREDFDPTAPWVMDTTTRGGAGGAQISDLGFFALFSDVKLKTLDVTDYEGAEIVHDMHQPVPAELHDRFDFLWNGSCLDNMFDPATAMKSTARMLKPGGRAICMEMVTPHFNAYTCYSQAWFFDYFALNNFEDAKIYTVMFDPAHVWSGPYETFMPTTYDVSSGQMPIQSGGMAMITLSIAEKGPDTSWDLMPIQGQYRPDHDAYRASYARFQDSTRAPLDGEKTEGLARQFAQIPYIAYLGRLAGAPDPVVVRAVNSAGLAMAG